MIIFALKSNYHTNTYDLGCYYYDDNIWLIFNCSTIETIYQDELLHDPVNISDVYDFIIRNWSRYGVTRLKSDRIISGYDNFKANIYFEKLF